MLPTRDWFLQVMTSLLTPSRLQSVGPFFGPSVRLSVCRRSRLFSISTGRIGSGRTWVGSYAAHQRFTRAGATAEATARRDGRTERRRVLDAIIDAEITRRPAIQPELIRISCAWDPEPRYDEGLPRTRSDALTFCPQRLPSVGQFPAKRFLAQTVRSTEQPTSTCYILFRWRCHRRWCLQSLTAHPQAERSSVVK